MERLLIKNLGKKLATMHFCVNSGAKNKRQFTRWLADSIPFNPNIGYAGYRNKATLQAHLPWILGYSGKFDTRQLKKMESIKPTILKTIRRALVRCDSVVSLSQIHVFVFPSFDRFVAEKMRGVFGFSPWKGTMLLAINTHSKKWKPSLKKTVGHEFAHLASLKHHPWKTLLDGIIFEGLAENFRETAIGGGRAPWTKALVPSRTNKIFNELKGSLDSKDLKLYNEVFYLNKKYPRWTGYTIGYYIVKAYLKSTKIDWPRIFRKPPKEILRMSGFTSVRN